MAFTPQTFTSLLNLYLPEPQASLLNGIILGLPLKTDYQFYQQLKTVGLIHLVVLSGMNITLLAAIVGVITKRLGKKPSIIVTIVTIVFFIIFVGPQAPVIRAGFMGILSLIGIIFGRKTIALYSLMLSAIFIAVIWPDWPKTISFQLSYAATLGLIIFSARCHCEEGVKRLTKQSSSKKIASPDRKQRDRDDTRNKLIGYLQDELRTSLAAQVFTVPLIFFYFRQVSFISPLANLLVSWTIAPLMVFGFLAVLLGKVSFILGVVPAYVSYILLSWIIIVVKTLALLPFASIKF